MKTILFCIGVAQFVSNPSGQQWHSTNTVKVQAAETNIINPIDTGSAYLYDSAGDSVLVTVKNCQ